VKASETMIAEHLTRHCEETLFLERQHFGDEIDLIEFAFLVGCEDAVIVKDKHDGEDLLSKFEPHVRFEPLHLAEISEDLHSEDEFSSCNNVLYMAPVSPGESHISID